MNKRARKPRTKRNLADEITDTEKQDQHQTVSFTISILRSLYMHGLLSMRNGDYPTFSSYVADLIRRDKHVRNQHPDKLMSIPVDERTADEKRVGFEKKEAPILG